MAPLSAALRQAIFRVQQTQLDNSQMPEVAAIRSLQALAVDCRSSLAALNLLPNNSDQSRQTWSELSAQLAATPEGQAVLRQFEQWLDQYGYLSEVGTDIAVPTWREDPGPVQDLWLQFVQHPPDSPAAAIAPKQNGSNWKLRQAQQRLNLKGQVTACYSHLLAELRWSFVALEQYWLRSGLLNQAGDLFFLEFDEIQQLVANSSSIPNLSHQIAQRRSQLEHDRQLTPPLLVYGHTPPILFDPAPIANAKQLQGIAASPGQVAGQVRVLQSFQDSQNGAAIDRNTILVVPYTDSGWAALLARAGGLIAEVGGQLSHGAIVAREYGIPAVMNVANATQILQDGQPIRIDGETGTIKLLSEESPT
ncbi:PEP-utilizing enzyme [Leptolyngbya sp. 7M]|uniref:PEP-utilizing enzyme n=1 Tax=Leptolyngbya sp. 7M TaxID=2812896 RepID=UPI001B8D5BFC|nr:PEP-utilizing enzyme [Leptolyngbya sp. 7M]QYO63491.1 hypothetical protein JVX88_26900 [Leptolyngbya sp. 7M]